MNFKSFQNKLLDLSRTNNLINYKDRLYTSLSIKSDLDILYDGLLNDKSFEAFNLDKYISKYSGADLKEADVEYDDIYREISSNIKDNHIVFYKHNGSVNSILKNLKKKAQEAIDEKGINILYIAFGMINYNDNKGKYLAPLLLVPVSIISDSKKFKISLYEEEAILNPNMRYKLMIEEKVKLRDIEPDEKISSYINYVTNQIIDLGYDVLNEGYLSLFSFTKINMYLDMMENESKVLSSPLVKGILNDGNIKLEAPSIIPTSDAMIVVDADHTQLEAIEAIRRGESIVLEGPPGTGKSQTITNIISSAIYDGKKVLFVSEKMAALNVVYEKLKRTGLDEFALELHSSKSNKKEVITELYNTLYMKKTSVTKKALSSLDELKGISSILDDYASSLHKVFPLFSLSLYELFNLYYKTPGEAIDYPNEMLSDDNINKAIKLIEKYESYKDLIGIDYKKFSYYGFNSTLSNKFLLKELVKIKEELTPLLKNYNFIRNDLKINLLNIKEYEVFESIYPSFNSKYFNKRLFNKKKIASALEIIDKLIDDRKKYLISSKFVEKYFDERIYADKYTNLYDTLVLYKGKMFKFFNKDYRKAMKSLNNISKSKINYKKALSSLENAKIAHSILKTFDVDAIDVRSLIENYDGLDTNMEEIKNLCIAINKGYEIKDFKEFKFEELELEKFNENCFKNISSSFESDPLLIGIEDIYKKVNSMIRDIDMLNTWNKLNSDVIAPLNNMGVLIHLDSAIENFVDLTAVLKKSYYKSAIDYIISHEPTLANFNQIDTDKLVSDFIKLYDNSFEINQSIIKNKLEGLKPNPDAITSGTASATIKREYLKKRKQMSVREILNTDPEFIQTLKPIFLMSPLSVSTFLGEGLKFDLVVFDEASQVFPEDAIGSIYRSSQMVIVGDSKQMPPTNFFHSMTEDEDDVDSASDFESILDLSKAFLKSYRLLWHYRSKNEGLIAFSNDKFYDHNLITFPSSKISDVDFGIEGIYVKGVYDHNNRYNMTEAIKVCEIALEHIKKYGSTRSLGIVAFSISQQRLIERMLRESLDKEKIELENSEPIFVKNLETVQGDERDTIIFSIGYGYDENHKFIQNFGPLNREGGERRLNVAISRARYNLKVVTSIMSSDITSAKSQGAILLRDYLSFVFSDRSKLAISENTDGFISEVGEFLKSSGYEIDYNVGFSSAKIDICIKNNDSYKYAVECDSNTYYDAKEANDRNRIRKNILESQGFKYIRVYSTEWYKDKAKAIKLLTASLDKKGIVKEEKLEAVSSVEYNDTFSNYIMSNDEKLIEKYKNGEIDFKMLYQLILENESPLSEKWFLERFKAIYDGRMGNILDEYELDKAMHFSSNEEEVKDGFVFKKGIKIALRVPSLGAIPRDISNIHPLEIAYGMKILIAKNHGMEKNELFKKLNTILGYKRTNKKIEEIYEKALKELSNIAFIKKNDERIEVLDL